MRGQVSIFIILGILIMSLFVIAFLFLGFQQDSASYPENAKEVHLFVEECVKNSVKPSAELIAYQGGYINLEGRKINNSDFNTAYGIYNETNTFVSVREMEEQLASRVDNVLLDCVNNFSTFNGRNITFEKPDTRVSISSEKIDANVQFPIKIETENSVSRINEFSTVARVPLGKTHSIGKKIIKRQLENPNWLDISYYSGLEGNINFIPVDSENIVATVLYEDFLFTFGIETNTNKPPVLNLYKTITLADGKTWKGKINCTDPDGDSTRITDNSPLVNTTEDGVITIQPEIPGEYNITFRCSDGHYNQVKETLSLKVKSVE